MNYEIELKVVDDELGRLSDNVALKIALEKYIEGFKGAVVLHESIYDYNYNTENNKYYDVDKLNIIGHVKRVIDRDDKIFLQIDISKELDLNINYICFYRASLEHIKTGTTEYNNINIYAVDLIKVLPTENVSDSNVSDITII